MQLPETPAPVTANDRNLWLWTGLSCFQEWFCFGMMYFIIGNKPQSNNERHWRENKSSSKASNTLHSSTMPESSHQHPTVCDLDLLLYPVLYIVYLPLEADREVLIPKGTGRLSERGEGRVSSGLCAEESSQHGAPQLHTP